MVPSYDRDKRPAAPTPFCEAGLAICWPSTDQTTHSAVYYKPGIDTLYQAACRTIDSNKHCKGNASALQWEGKASQSPPNLYMGEISSWPHTQPVVKSKHEEIPPLWILSLILIYVLSLTSGRKKKNICTVVGAHEPLPAETQTFPATACEYFKGIHIKTLLYICSEGTQLMFVSVCVSLTLNITRETVLDCALDGHFTPAHYTLGLLQMCWH